MMNIYVGYLTTKVFNDEYTCWLPHNKSVFNYEYTCWLNSHSHSSGIVWSDNTDGNTRDKTQKQAEVKHTAHNSSVCEVLVFVLPSNKTPDVKKTLV